MINGEKLKKILGVLRISMVNFQGWLYIRTYFTKLIIIDSKYPNWVLGVLSQMGCLFIFLLSFTNPHI